MKGLYLLFIFIFAYINTGCNESMLPTENSAQRTQRISFEVESMTTDLNEMTQVDLSRTNKDERIYFSIYRDD